MPADRLLKPLPAGQAHYALQLEGRTVIMAPNSAGGHSSVLELRPHDILAPRVDLPPIADIICRHLDGLFASPAFRAAWDPNSQENPT
jgi:hypothetical protein